MLLGCEVARSPAWGQTSGHGDWWSEGLSLRFALRIKVEAEAAPRSQTHSTRTLQKRCHAMGAAKVQRSKPQ